MVGWVRELDIAERKALDAIKAPLLAEIERLRVALKGIEVYSANHDDARGMAAKALLHDEQKTGECPP